MEVSIIKGRVVKSIAGVFTVNCEGKDYACLGRGKLKRFNKEICVGDLVDFNYNQVQGKGTIEAFSKRKNFLQRPPVANVDQVVIVIAPVPEPDFLLVDKMILNALKNDLSITVCINKLDIASDEFVDKVTKEYINVADNFIMISAKEGTGVERLQNVLDKKLSCFAGQSAVGKSSIVNVLVGREVLAVGELSQRIQRGKNTTRHSEILQLKDGGLVVDTPGFTFIDFFDSTNPEDLHYMYSDFAEYENGCKYRGCLHIDEPICGVKNAIKDGKIANGRYERYVKIYSECLDKWKNRYK